MKVPISRGDAKNTEVRSPIIPVGRMTGFPWSGPVPLESILKLGRHSILHGSQVIILIRSLGYPAGASLVAPAVAGLGRGGDDSCCTSDDGHQDRSTVLGKPLLRGAAGGGRTFREFHRV